jgi:membrane-associated protein
METVLSFVQMHAQDAHWIFFCLILLSGFNLPVSEDAVIIIGGAITAVYLTEHTLRMVSFLFIASILSAWITYWIGRLLGPKLLSYPWFNRVITQKRIDKIKSYFIEYGLYTFMGVHFLPGAARNALFFTSGLTQMPFRVFALRDGLAVIFPFSILFTTGYLFGGNLDIILHYLKVYSTAAVTFVVLVVVLLVVGYWILGHRIFPKK